MSHFICRMCANTDDISSFGRDDLVLHVTTVSLNRTYNNIIHMYHKHLAVLPGEPSGVFANHKMECDGLSSSPESRLQICDRGWGHT
jgi:hypothetical protein